MWGFVAVVVSCCFLEAALGSLRSERHSEKRPVYIGGLLPDTHVSLTVQHALKDINKSPHVLPNHDLRFMYAEIKECDVERGFEKYLDLVDILPRKLLLLTGLCPEMIRVVERESGGFGRIRNPPRTLQISYENSDSEFETSFHPSLFRLLPPDSAFNEARTQLLAGFESKAEDVEGIGLLYQNAPKYRIPHAAQVTKLFHGKGHGLASEAFEGNATTEDVRGVLRRLREKNVGILFGNFESAWARRIFCLAYNEKMYGDSFIWLLAGDYELKWWRVDDTACTLQELERALDGMLRIDNLPFHTANLERKSPEFRNFHEGVKMMKHQGYVYDAVWAMAHALHNVSHFYAQDSKTQPLSSDEDVLTNSSINFQNPLWEEALYRSLAQVSFIGVTGPVSFNKKQGRVGFSLLVKQFQAHATGYDEVNVGEYESMAGTLNLVKYPHRLIRRWKQVLYSTSELGEAEEGPKHNEVKKDRVTEHGHDPYSTSPTDGATRLKGGHVPLFLELPIASALIVLPVAIWQ